MIVRTSLRNYTVGIKVSSLWYSGTTCNCDMDTNTVCSSNCLKWNEIVDGMPNNGEWYEFE